MVRFLVTGRSPGDDLLTWLRTERGLDGWWLCYNADAAMLARHAASCLAHHLGVSADVAAAAMGSSGLIGTGVSAATRKSLLGGVAMRTERASGRAGHRYFWLGAAEPGWTIQMQLDGLAHREPPIVPR